MWTYICPNVILCSSMIQRNSDSLTHRKRTVLLGKITVNLLSSSRVHANHDNSGSNAPHKNIIVYRVLQQRCKTQLMERDMLSLKFYCHVSLFTLRIKRIRGMNVHSYSLAFETWRYIHTLVNTMAFLCPCCSTGSYIYIICFVWLKKVTTSPIHVSLKHWTSFLYSMVH